MDITKIISGIGCLSSAVFASGIVLISIAVAWKQHNRNFVQTAEQVEGTVIEVVERRHDGKKLFLPVVEFSDHLGQKRKFQPKISYDHNITLSATKFKFYMTEKIPNLR